MDQPTKQRHRRCRIGGHSNALHRLKALVPKQQYATDLPSGAYADVGDEHQGLMVLGKIRSGNGSNDAIPSKHVPRQP